MTHVWKANVTFRSTAPTRLRVQRQRMWLNGLVVSALGIRARGPGFDSRGVVPLFHWVATIDREARDQGGT